MKYKNALEKCRELGKEQAEIIEKLQWGTCYFPKDDFIIKICDDNLDIKFSSYGQDRLGQTSSSAIATLRRFDAQRLFDWLCEMEFIKPGGAKQ